MLTRGSIGSHHLAAISGSIEAGETPLAAAWRELLEETSLTTRDVELWRQGNPFSFSDPSVGRQWTIHPFSFRLKGISEGGRGEDAIRIDWEHEGWEWQDPATMADDDQFGGVPRLRESLRRVWFEGDVPESASKALNAGLHQLRTDRQSGSHELTSSALRIFREVLVQLHGEGEAQWWETARMVAWHLWKNGRESMGAATMNALLGVLADMEHVLDQDLHPEFRRDRLFAAIDHHLEQRKTMPTRIQQSFADYLRGHFMSEPQQVLSILTLSASSTIRDSIVDAYSSFPIATLDLRILESRPLYEGVSMAAAIAAKFKSKFPSPGDRDLNLTVYTDASAALASQNIDFVLLGADRISDSGWISNKTGSLPAVLSAKHVSPNAKVLVFSELEKVAEPGAVDEHRSEESDPHEVIRSWITGSTEGAKTFEGDAKECVQNTSFEWVPAPLVDGYISEEGTLDVAAIQRQAQQVKQKADRYFGRMS
ncbi:uncharacterized protein PFLUO_LOCUS2253 [Penicillium psychrofluorescens]|uniref:uncharacterized protein n=1 Tax=Penicillium psychrofluorescens TaxID=3158075 RepID=UPI003CCD3045